MKIIFMQIALLSFAMAGMKNDYQQNLTEKINYLKTKVSYVEPLELKRQLDKEGKDNIYILDVRQENEVIPQGHIDTKNYLNIPRGLVEFKIKKNIEDMDQKIIIVCYTEVRSLFVYRNLFELGYRNIKVLKGGMERWNNECLPKKEETNLFFEEKQPASCGGDDQLDIIKFNGSRFR